GHGRARAGAHLVLGALRADRKLAMMDAPRSFPLGPLGVLVTSSLLAMQPAHAEVRDHVGTCFGASFDRQTGPLKELTVRFTPWTPGGRDGLSVVVAFTEWDVPNQIFEAGIACDENRSEERRVGEERRKPRHMC